MKSTLLQVVEDKPWQDCPGWLKRFSGKPRCLWEWRGEGCARNVLYLDLEDSFTGVCTCKKSLCCPLKVYTDVSYTSTMLSTWLQNNDARIIGINEFWLTGQIGTCGHSQHYPFSNRPHQRWRSWCWCSEMFDCQSQDTIKLHLWASFHSECIYSHNLRSYTHSYTQFIVIHTDLHTHTFPYMLTQLTFTLTQPTLTHTHNHTTSLNSLTLPLR